MEHNDVGELAFDHVCLDLSLKSLGEHLLSLLTGGPIVLLDPAEPIGKLTVAGCISIVDESRKLPHVAQ